MSVLIVGVGPQGNKFEQVSCDDQQMSVVGDRVWGVRVCGRIVGTHVPMHLR